MTTHEPMPNCPEQYRWCDNQGSKGKARKGKGEAWKGKGEARREERVGEEGASGDEGRGDGES